MLTPLESASVLLIAEIEHAIVSGEKVPYKVVIALHEAKKKLCDDAKKLAQAHKLAVKLV